MKLETALDEFGLLQRRRYRGDEAQLNALALSAVREYLLDYASLETTEALSQDDLFSFLLEYYPSQEEPETDVALKLLDVCSGFAKWLLERDERVLATFALAEERLRLDLPRVLDALVVLREHAHRDDVSNPIAVMNAEQDEDNGLGEMTGGLDRLMQLDEVDYDAAQMDYFTVESVGKTSLALQSSSREILQEGVADPVFVPARVSELLRPGDIVYAEIAPRKTGWEVLEVFGIRPGGYE